MERTNTKASHLPAEPFAGEIPNEVSEIGSGFDFPPSMASSTLVETIVAAAIRVAVPVEFTAQMYRGKPVYPEHLIVTAPPPARHGTLLHPFGAVSGLHVSPADQGFVTSTGRYVDREEALQIVKASNQPRMDHPAGHERLLFSEDLW